MPKRVLIGILFVVGGPALLLVTTGVVRLSTVWFPVLIVLIGLLALYRAFLPGGGEVNVFAGTFLTSSGLFLVLKQSFLTSTELSSIWPVFVTIGGGALVAYGIRKGRGYRFSLTIPGITLVALSLIFLLFSLNIVEQSLAGLAARWWPVLLVPLGALVILGQSDDSHSSS